MKKCGGLSILVFIALLFIVSCGQSEVGHNHSYVNGVCIYCEPANSKELEYRLLSDGTYEVVAFTFF